jgi:hypothetical protein
MREDNLYVFLDAEYTNRTRSAKLMSLGLSALTHRKESFYAEFNDYSLYFLDEKAKNQVQPSLLLHDRDNLYQEADMEVFAKSDSGTIRSLILEWLNKIRENHHNKRITFVVDCGSMDWFLFTNLLGFAGDEKNLELPIWMSEVPLDVSTMMYIAGFDPETDRNKFLGLKESSGQYNALASSKRIKMAYSMMMNVFFQKLYNERIVEEDDIGEFHGEILTDE